MDNGQDFKQTRRNMLKGVVFTAGTATVAGLAGRQAHAAAGAKLISKSVVKYQDKPNGDKECSKCIQFIPGASVIANGTCGAVNGTISPHGYCLAFSPKA
jgi:hypothetical protein